MLHICYILPIFRIKKAPIGAVACPQWVSFSGEIMQHDPVFATNKIIVNYPLTAKYINIIVPAVARDISGWVGEVALLQDNTLSYAQFEINAHSGLGVTAYGKAIIICFV